MEAHGYFDYGRINEVADEIEREFLNNGRYFVKGDKKVHDRIGDASKNERREILDEIKDLILDLRYCADRVKELEWYMSGDINSSGYLKRIGEIEIKDSKKDVN